MSNKDTMSRFYDAINAGETDVVYEVCAEDLVEHEEFPGIPPTRDGVKQFFEMARSAFPDFHMQVDHMVAEGDMVIAHGVMEGTQEGEFMGMPASHHAIKVPMVDVVRFRDGRAVEHWGVTDSGIMMQQLGAAPATAG